MTRWATTTEIARQAGVSRATVDRVLHERPGVHPRTVRLVRETAEALRQMAAQPGPALRGAGQVFRIAAVLPSGANGFLHDLSVALGGQGNPQLSITLLRSASFNAADAVAALSRVPDGIDGLILVAPDAPAVHEALRRFRAARTPVLTVASPIAGADAYVGIDNRSAGRVAAQLVARFVRADAGVVGLQVDNLSYRGQEEREMGFRAVLGQDAPGLRVETTDTAQGDDAQMAATARRLVERHPDLRAIYNTGSGNGAIAQALADLGRRDIVLVGHDLTDETRALLLDGRMDAAVVQSSEAEAEAAAEVMAALLGDPDTTQRSRVLPWQIVLRESLV